MPAVASAVRGVKGVGSVVLPKEGGGGGDSEMGEHPPARRSVRTITSYAEHINVSSPSNRRTWAGTLLQHIFRHTPVSKVDKRQTHRQQKK